MAVKVTWKGRLAQVAITIGALALFLVIRPDYVESVQAHYAKVSSPRHVEQYLANNKVRKLQIGAGNNNFPGWLNTDLFPVEGQVYLDATARFPLPDASIHYIFAEHVVEHITYEQGHAMLRECHRVLAPGGRIRLVTPNLKRFIALFNENKTEEQRKYIVGKTAWHEWPTTAEQETYILNMQLREWGHLFVYSPAMLSAVMAKTGFREVKEFSAGETGDDTGFKGLDVRAASNIREINLYEAMAIEAVK